MPTDTTHSTATSLADSLDTICAAINRSAASDTYRTTINSLRADRSSPRDMFAAVYRYLTELEAGPAANLTYEGRDGPVLFFDAHEITGQLPDGWTANVVVDADPDDDGSAPAGGDASWMICDPSGKIVAIDADDLDVALNADTVD